jgi:hypothetical protein
MPVKTETIYLSREEESQLTLTSNFLEESVIFTISSPTQQFREVYLELPAEDLSELIQHLSAIYAELVLETEEGPKND